MTGHFGQRAAWACRALLALFTLAVATATPALAQTTYCLPTCSQTDARFISLAGSGYRSVAGDQIAITLASGSTTDSVVFEIFDGETSGVWDAGTSPLVFSLYADRHGDGTGTRLVGQWSGRGMADTAWHRIAVRHDTNARAESGAFFYMLKVRIQWGDTTDANGIEDDTEDGSAVTTWSNFKIRSTSHMMTTQFAFCAPLFSMREGNIVYPNYPLLTNSTYDGTWSLFVQVPKPIHTLEVWDGDMDFGSWDGLAMDTDDFNTNSNTVPRWSGTSSVEEGVASGIDLVRTVLGTVTSILGTGAPMDDNLSLAYRRSPSVIYDVVDPAGVSYRNNNPSGNLEWERFVIGTSSSTTTLDANATFLPRGLYEMRLSGMDMHNLNAWRYSEGVVGSTPQGEAEKMPDADCPKNVARTLARGPVSHSSGEISVTGEVYVWGDNCVGQLGDGTTTDRTSPVRVLKGDYPGTTYLGDGCNGVASLATSHKRMIVLMQDGMVYSWGENVGGILGVGTTAGNVTAPKRVLKGDYPGTTYIGDNWKNPIEAVAAGEFFGAAVSNKGLVYTWGRNNRGQLGDGTTTDRSGAVRVLKGAYNGTTYLGDNPNNPIIDVVAGDETCYALAANGEVFAWGYNNNGQIGDGTTTTRTTPVKVLKGAYAGTLYLGDASSNPIKAIAAMPMGCLALTKAGTVFAWGNNSNGQLGDNSTTDRSTPVCVLKGAYPGTTYLGDSTSHKIVAIAGGGLHALALSSRGHVYSWGRNAEGALGDNTNTSRHTPVRVLKGEYVGTTYLGDSTAITNIGGGFHHSLAITGSNYSTYSWGDGYEGRLGDGTTTNRATPVRVTQGARPGYKVSNELQPVDGIVEGSSSDIAISSLSVRGDASELHLALEAMEDVHLSVELYTIGGDLVSRPIEHHSMHAGNHSLDVALPDDLSSGMYLLMVRTHNGSRAQQFAVTR